MQSSHSLDRIATRFDDGHLIADAGLLLPATLAQHLGLQQLFDEHVSLGANPGRAHIGAKALTLILSALAGGDCIDDAGALRAGGTQAVLGHDVAAPSSGIVVELTPHAAGAGQCAPPIGGVLS